ncbi:MAG: hypothetical protein R3F61_28985 [Myxococcota bacterium]
MRRSVVILPLALALLGCMGWFQSKSAGIQVICDAPIDCETCMRAPPDMRLQMLAGHIEANLYQADAIALMEAMAMASPDDRTAMLRKEATANGIQKCVLAEMWETANRETWSFGIEQVCSLTDCARDPSDPGAVVTCVASNRDVPELVGEAVEQLDTSSPQALAADLQKLAAKHGQPACALSATLRNAR